MSACAGIFVTVAVTPAVAVTGLAAADSITAFDDLPGYLQIGPPDQDTTIYAKRSGQEVPIASFYAEDRVDVAWNQIAQSVKDAAVATEDPDFYSEGGVDIVGTIRGALSTATGHELEGGSSITQQYVKNVLIQKCTEDTNQKKEQACYDAATAITPQRKLQEMRYAITLNKTYTKNEILRGYLDIVGFGGDVYGVQAAAEYYFDTSAADLTLPESATLVAILNNPNDLRIDQPDDKANGTANGYALTLARRNYVLQRMLVHHAITRAQYDAAVAIKITPTITPQPSGCASAAKYDAAFFCEYVQDVMLNDTAFGKTADARWATLNEGGLKVYTTLHLGLQQQVQNAVSSYIPASDPELHLGAASVSVEPGTGRIITMVENKSFNDTDQTIPGTTAINYNTDYAYGGSAGFETGSAFKAFTLAAWLEAGHSLTQEISTTQHDFSMSDFHNSCQSIAGPPWYVTNDDPAPPVVNVLQATAASINTAFVNMGTQLDLCSILKAAEALGVHAASPANPLTSVPSMILGINYISPLTMATAYAGIANGGVVCTPIAIQSITGPQGQSIPATPTSCTRGIPANVAAAIAYDLEGVLQPGGTAATANPEDGIPVFAKTGTSDDTVENWLVTSTTKIATATWVGNISGSVPLEDVDFDGYAGNNVKFPIGKQILQVLDGRYGGSAFPAVDPAFLGGGGGGQSQSGTAGSEGGTNTAAGTPTSTTGTTPSA